MNLRNWFPARSIRTQLVILLFSVTAIILVFLSYLGVTSVLSYGGKTQNITGNAMKARVEQFLIQTTTATAEKNSIILHNIQDEDARAATYATSVFETPSLYDQTYWKFDQHVTKVASSNYANPQSEPGSVYIPSAIKPTAQLKREIELTTYFDDLFPLILVKEPNVVAAYFIGTQGDTKYYPNIGLGGFLPADYTPVTDVFFAPVTPDNDPDKTFKWSVVYDDPAGNGLLLSALNPVYTKDHGFKGVVDLDITLNNIAKNIESYTPIESSYAFLIDQSGRTIALPAQGYTDILGRAQKDKEFGPDLKDVKGDFGTVLTSMRAGKSGFSAVKAGNRDLYVAYAPVAGTTFSLGIAAKQSTLLSVVADLQKQVKNTTDEMVYSRILPFGAGLLVLVWILSFFFIKRYTDPLKQLTATTAQLSGGNFDVQPAKVSLDNEIGQLASSFNSMVADLKASHTKIEDQNKELIREQLRLKASINSMPFGFAIVNPENEIVFHNAVLAHLMNRDIPDTPAASRRVLEAVSTEYKATIDLLSCLKTTLDSRQPTEHGVEIGPRFFRFFFAPIIDEVDGAEQAIGTVMVMEDTTEARAMERSRDEFFSIASHELRTPLTAIRGNSKMIIDYFGDQLKDPSLKEMVGDIHESSLRLITIVNDFLDTSRLEQGKMVFKKESLNLPDLMAKTIREFDADDTRNGNVLEFKPADTPIPAVMADAERVQQIIINLLSNAFKFTDKGVVTIALGLSGPDKIKISVADTGKGIPMESQHLLFHKFQQASNNILTRDNTRSTGLGLYISKLMAEGMGGRLYLESTEVDKGSVFALELPVGEAGGVEPAKPARKSAAESKNVSVKVKPS